MTIDEAPSVGMVKTQTVRLIDPPDKLSLESGKSLTPIDVAYETYGTLNRDKSNAILLCHALSGDAHAAGYHTKNDTKPGWWDRLVGPKKAFDTDHYFVICTNFLGGCKGTTGPNSINPQTNQPYGLDFPVITVSDMVNLQKRFIDHLGIPRLKAVTGGSLGGMQAMEWAIQYPEMIENAIVIAAAAHVTAQGIAFHEIGRHAIVSDPQWQQGNYNPKVPPKEGLSIARMVGHITYLSDYSFNTRFGRRLQDKDKFDYNFSKEFQVESYLHYKGSSFVKRFDANTYLYISKTMDYFDLEGKYGSLKKAFEKVKAKFLILSFTSDWLFPTRQSKDLVNALLANDKHVSFVEVETDYGHDAFLMEGEKLKALIGRFLIA